MSTEGSRKAENQKRYRARLRSGAQVWPLTVNDVDSTEMLIAAGYLRREDEDDQLAKYQAASELWAWLSRPANDA